VTVSRTFDENELLDRVDNDWDFLAETVQMLEGDGPPLVQELRRAAASGDAPAVARVGHTLKGMISNFCSPAAHASAMALEQVGKSGDLSSAPPALDALERDLNALVADLHQFVATRTRCVS
jgi:two-component system, sensor histidine kinase and response regulator